MKGRRDKGEKYMYEKYIPCLLSPSLDPAQ
jgi:hypothetical protein